jgi:hypothetical protein
VSPLSPSKPAVSGLRQPLGWVAGAQSFFRHLSASVMRREELGVALFPDRLILARVGGGWHRRLVHKEIIALAPPAPDAPRWQPAVEALAGKAASGGLAGADVTLVLSNHFVHYALVPWSELLQGEEEQLAFARSRFVRVHGGAAESWSLRLSRGEAREARLACGVEEALIEALNATLAPIGERYRSLQPHLMASFNRWRIRLGARPRWFVVAEPGLMCLALLQGGQWKSVRTVRTGADWTEELPGALTREQFLIDSQAECDFVSVFAPDSPAPATLEAGAWKIEYLQPKLLPDMAAGVDAPFSIAVGA